MHEHSSSAGDETSHADTSHHDTNHHSHQEIEDHDLNSHFHSHEDPEDHHHNHKHQHDGPLDDSENRPHKHPQHQHDGPTDEYNPLLPPSYGTVNYYHPSPHIQRENQYTRVSSVFGSIFKALFVLVWFGMAAFILMQAWKGFFCPLKQGSVWDFGCDAI